MSESSSLVWATEATAHDDYFCARCGVTLLLDAGDHAFQHPDSSYCSAILSVQKSALIYMRDILESSANSPLQIKAPCCGCDRGVVIDLTEGFRRCSMVQAEDGKEALFIISDWLRLLVLMRPASPELCHQSHILDAHWLEIDSRNVFSNTMIDVLGGTLPRSLCEQCDQQELLMRDQIREAAERTGTEFDTSLYRARLEICWSCKQIIILFSWNKGRTWQIEQPPKPIPVSVQWRWSRRWRCSRWVNTCPLCCEIQEDHDAGEDYAGRWY